MQFFGNIRDLLQKTTDFQCNIYLNGNTSDNTTHGMPKLVKQTSIMNKTIGSVSVPSGNVCFSYENTPCGRLVPAYMLMKRLQNAVAERDPMTSLRLPINLTMTAESRFITMKTAPTSTWKQKGIIYSQLNRTNFWLAIIVAQNVHGCEILAYFINLTCENSVTLLYIWLTSNRETNLFI